MQNQADHQQSGDSMAQPTKEKWTRQRDLRRGTDKFPGAKQTSRPMPCNGTPNIAGGRRNRSKHLHGHDNSLTIGNQVSHHWIDDSKNRGDHLDAPQLGQPPHVIPRIQALH